MAADSGANVNYVTQLIMARFNSLLMLHYAYTMRRLIINANGTAALRMYCVVFLLSAIPDS